MINLKVVINRCYGGFSLSTLAIYEMANRGSDWAKERIKDGYNSYSKLERHDPILVQVVEELRDKANGPHSKLEIKEINLGYSIDSFDGMETIVGNSYLG